jgi:hypothetical protein
VHPNFAQEPALKLTGRPVPNLRNLPMLPTAAFGALPPKPRRPRPMRRANCAAGRRDAGGAAAHAATGGPRPHRLPLAIFVLAIFVGYYVVWSVTPALHTPLMS